MIYQAHSHFLVSGSDVEFAKGQLGAAVPWSLYYDGANDIVDCGAGATIDDLPAGQMTADIYYQYTAVGGGANQIFIAQIVPGVSGWLIYRDFASFYFYVRDGAGFKQAAVASGGFVAGTWYYIRARKTATGTLIISRNLVAGAATAAVGAYVPTAASMTMGNDTGLTFDLLGRICYTHLWNTDKGALAAVPTAPFAVDANTAGRWIHSDGAGAVLTDTSGNGNNGAITGAAWSATVPAGWTL